GATRPCLSWLWGDIEVFLLLDRRRLAAADQEAIRGVDEAEAAEGEAALESEPAPGGSAVERPVDVAGGGGPAVFGVDELDRPLERAVLGEPAEGVENPPG